MKRWAEFERERRNRSGTQSRDTYDVIRRTGSPVRSDSNRMSVVSSDESSFSGPSSGTHPPNEALGKPASRIPVMPAPLSRTSEQNNFYNSASSPTDAKGSNPFSSSKGYTDSVPLLDLGGSSAPQKKNLRSGASRTGLNELVNDRESSASSSSHSGHQSSGLATRSTSSAENASLPPYRMVEERPPSANRPTSSSAGMPRRQPGGPRGPRPST